MNIKEITDELIACDTPELARAVLFDRCMGLYEDDCIEEVGYYLGYYDEDTRIRLCTWLDINHPFFGKARVTIMQAFASGQAFALGATKEVIRTLLDPPDRSKDEVV